MTVANRRLLKIAGVISVLILAIDFLGSLLLQHAWFLDFITSPVIFWLMSLLGFTLYVGTPVVLIVLVWRWEPLAKNWMTITARWLLGIPFSILGLFLTSIATTGMRVSFLPVFYKMALLDPGLYWVSASSVALLGFVDWFFFTRHWKNNQVPQNEARKT